jgi:hypothetical protein
MSDDITGFLFGGGGRAARFDKIGDMVTGQITDVRLTQQTAMETNEPMTWSDGRPRMQLVVSMATDDRVDENDDGIRTVYAKGGNYEASTGAGTSMKDAISDALKRAKATTIEVGGVLTVAYTGEGKKTNRGFTAPKLWRAKYEPPVKGVAADDIFGAGAPPNDDDEPF